ncbi:MAG: phosphate regulon sensor histidine kinase PhoR [Burkholderiaceae bacterium]|nr:phosphate regulon sensor histidine kinase PhoR [Burkholderiaceae bacterium]
MIWLKGLRSVLFALALAGALAWLFSARAAAWWLAGFTLLYAIAQTAFLAKLYRWGGLPRSREVPISTGAWEMVLERIARFVKSEHDTREALQAELAQVHAAVDQLPDGLALLDQYDHIDWCNNAATELHGIFGVGRPIHHFIRHPGFVAYLEGEDFGKPPVLPLATRPGRLFELRLHRNDDGTKLLITRDLTELARVDAMRRDFVANVSHEIRTPVTVIGGFAETLLEGDDDPDARREYLTMILRQSQTMQRLVEDLLTLSSLENADAPPADERIDLHALVATLVDEAQALSQGKHGIGMKLLAPRWVLGAASEIESAVRNLLTNAVRYTPAGGQIGVDWRLRDGDGLLSVRDSGIGIAPEHLARLTERFYRVDRGRSRETGGTGLGLAIVKHIAQRHGGNLQIESRPGQGSAFTLRIPASRLLPHPPDQGEQPDQAQSTAK